MTTLALSDPTAFALVGVLFLPVEIPIVYFGTRRAIQSWRRWTR